MRSTARRKTARRTLKEARNEWLFIAGNDEPPPIRIARLLEHAARVRPYDAIPITTVAQLTFGLPQEPSPKSFLTQAIVRYLRSVQRQLNSRDRGLVRRARSVRATVDDMDYLKNVTSPALERARRALGRYMEIISFSRIRPEDISCPELRKEMLEIARGLPDYLMTAEQRELQRAWISALEAEIHLAEPLN